MKILNNQLIYKIMFQAKTLVFYIKSYCSPGNDVSFKLEKSYDDEIKDNPNSEPQNIYETSPPAYVDHTLAGQNINKMHTDYVSDLG